MESLQNDVLTKTDSETPVSTPVLEGELLVAQRRITELELALSLAEAKVAELSNNPGVGEGGVLLGVVKVGTKMRDGMVLQRETPVHYEMQGSKRVVTGPPGVRPRILIGQEF